MPKLRVMTFNIHGACYQEDGVNAWESRASLNIKTITSARPDLIGFQELQNLCRESHFTPAAPKNSIATCKLSASFRPLLQHQSLSRVLDNHL